MKNLLIINYITFFEVTSISIFIVMNIQFLLIWKLLLT
jgi:hypothetical protein